MEAELIDNVYLVNSAGFGELSSWFFDNPNKNENPSRPGLRVGTNTEIGIILFNNIPIDVKE